MARNFSVALSLLLNSAQYTQALRGAANQTQSFRSKIMGAFLPIAGIAALGASIKTMIGTIFEQTKKLDGLNAGYKTVITNSDDLKNVYSQLNEMADRNGISINTLKTEYLGFAAASKGTALEGEKAMHIFDALTSSMGKLGSSEDATHRALIAVTQMMSKGTVASEELRGQLGEALPGAFNIAARAMGVSTMELGKMLKLGDVAAADMLPKFAAELKNTFGGDYKIDTLTAAQGRFGTSITQTIEKLSAGNIFKNLINSATIAIQTLAGIGKASDQYDPMVRKIQTLISTLKNFAVIVGIAFGVSKIMSFVAAIQKIQAATAALALTQRALAAIGTGTQTGALLAEQVRLTRLQTQQQGRLAASTGAISGAMSLLKMGLVVAAIAVVAYIVEISGAVKAFKDWRDSINGTKDALNGFNTQTSNETFSAALLFTELKNVTEGTRRYDEILGILGSKYSDIIKFYTDQKTGLLDIEKAQKAVNDEILRNASLSAVQKRQDEIGTTYAATVAPASQSILDNSGVNNDSVKTNSIKLLIEDLKTGKIEVAEFVKKVNEIGKVYDITRIVTFANDIAEAFKRAQSELGKLDSAIQVSPENAEMQAERARLKAEAAKKTANDLASTKALAATDQKAKAAKEAFEKESALLEKYSNIELADITEYLEAGRITKERFENLEIQQAIDKYTKLIALAEKYGKDSSALKLQLAQESLKLSQIKPGELMQPSFVRNDKPEVLRGLQSNDGWDKDILKKAQDEEEAFKKSGEDLGQAFSDGLSSMTTQAGESFGESLGKVFAGMDASEAFNGFGNSILQMVGQFLVALGSAMIVYGQLLDGLLKSWSPGQKIVLGVAAVVAGGILMGIASGGVKGASSGGGGGYSSGGNSYSSPGSGQAQNNNVVFEIKGNTLVGVLNNVNRKNSNTH